MSSIKASVLIVCFLSATSFFGATSGGKCKPEDYCTQMKAHGMWGADCFDRKLAKFPQCLRSDIEVVELSFNRLRKLTKDDVQKYSSIKMLYLADNLLTNLENSTFEGMDQLQVLDLSLNGITKLPPVVFHLPSLKRLYLSQNQNINVVEIIEETGQITSPLESIDIGFNDLETLPNFHIMPYLWLYNISGNNLYNMKPRNFAGLCRLQKLVNDNFTTIFDEPCDCWNIQKWLDERKVTFSRMPCDIGENHCPYNISDEDMNLYNKCASRYSELERQSVLLKIGIPVAVVALLLIIIVLYFLYRRKQRKAKERRRAQLEHYVAANDKKESHGLIV